MKSLRPIFLPIFALALAGCANENVAAKHRKKNPAPESLESLLVRIDASEERLAALGCRTERTTTFEGVRVDQEEIKLNCGEPSRLLELQEISAALGEQIRQADEALKRRPSPQQKRTLEARRRAAAGVKSRFDEKITALRAAPDAVEVALGEAKSIGLLIWEKNFTLPGITTFRHLNQVEASLRNLRELLRLDASTLPPHQHARYESLRQTTEEAWAALGKRRREMTAQLEEVDEVLRNLSLLLGRAGEGQGFLYQRGGAEDRKFAFLPKARELFARVKQDTALAEKLRTRVIRDFLFEERPTVPFTLDSRRNSLALDAHAKTEETLSLVSNLPAAADPLALSRQQNLEEVAALEQRVAAQVSLLTTRGVDSIYEIKSGLQNFLVVLERYPGHPQLRNVEVRFQNSEKTSREGKLLFLNARDSSDIYASALSKALEETPEK